MQQNQLDMGLIFKTMYIIYSYHTCENLLRRILERANIIDYIFNDVNKNLIRRNNNKIRRDPNHNQENDLSEASAATRSELGGYLSTTTSGTGSILLAGILAESEYARTVITNSHNNDETVQVVDIIDSEESSNYDMEDPDFVDDDENITNLYEEEDERNFMNKDWKWGSW